MMTQQAPMDNIFAIDTMTLTCKLRTQAIPFTDLNIIVEYTPEGQITRVIELTFQSIGGWGLEITTGWRVLLIDNEAWQARIGNIEITRVENVGMTIVTLIVERTR